MCAGDIERSFVNSQLRDTFCGRGAKVLLFCMLVGEPWHGSSSSCSPAQRYRQLQRRLESWSQAIDAWPSLLSEVLARIFKRRAVAPPAVARHSSRRPTFDVFSSGLRLRCTYLQVQARQLNSSNAPEKWHAAIHVLQPRLPFKTKACMNLTDSLFRNRTEKLSVPEGI